MPDSESPKPVERLRADPLKVAADMIAQAEAATTEADAAAQAAGRQPLSHRAGPNSPDESPSSAPDGSDNTSADDNDSPRTRRAIARAQRHSAAEKHRKEKAAARAYAALKRQSSRGSGAADSKNSPASDKTVQLPIVAEDVPSGGATSSPRIERGADPVVARRLNEEKRAAEVVEPAPDAADASIQRDEAQALDEEQAEDDRQERERQDAAQAQAEQVEASRIEAERQELERAATETAEKSEAGAAK
ncbi:MAG TPA: hypothetical protein VFC57_08220, partial [Aeromicrobium sp.]|nr:hypothetical protein [Aeromicrobium sp.]